MPNDDYLIDAETLLSNIEDSKLRIIDCRFDLSDPASGKRQYVEAHIAGAVFADLDRDLSVPPNPRTGRHPLPDAESFARTLGGMGVDNSMRVVVYDAANGALAARAWWMLRWVGHEQVTLLDGGLARWCQLGYPVSGGIETAPASRFVASPRDDLIVTTRELEDALPAIADLRLVDARDAARFRGEIEPIDAVAGHIPGASNLPLDSSLREDGLWRTPEQLRSIWRDVLGADVDTRWCAMCGSGVTACHLAISAMRAGYSEPRLYVGSWSEWIRDPVRPVATGPA